jgi:hypothetical protein
MSTATQTPVETYLLNLWESSELYAGAEIRPHDDGTLYTAWDIDQQRVCMKFIVDGGVTKPQFDDLSLDLALLLHAEGDRMRASEIAGGKAEDEARDLADSYGPYYMDVYLPDTTSDLTRADLLGIYGPELFLHFVPIHTIEGGAA